MVNLGSLPGGSSRTEAFGVSADGAVVVGTSNTDRAQAAFRWTKDGMVNIGQLIAGRKTEARGISADGSVIVGAGRINSNINQGFRRIEGGGLQLLPFFWPP